MYMQRKKIIIVTGVIVVLCMGGAAFAATHNSPIAKKSVVTQNKSMQDDTVTVTSNETEVIPEPVIEQAQGIVEIENESVSDSNTSTPAEASVTPSTIQTFTSVITNQAVAIAPLFAWTTADDFVAIQLQCLGRGVTENSPQSQLDSLYTFLAPVKLDNGQTQYRYYSGGCQVRQVIR